MNTNQPTILLTRVDNRMVHGQVGVTWTKTLGANLILVADDETANNTIQQKLMKSIAKSSGAEIRFFTLEQTADIIYQARKEQRIYIVVKTIHSVRILVEKGVPIQELNLGNLHFSHGKKMVTKKVYVDETDIQDIEYLLSKGIKIFIQDVPGDQIYKIQKMEDLEHDTFSIFRHRRNID